LARRDARRSGQLRQGRQTLTRALEEDRTVTAPDGSSPDAARPLAAVRSQRRPSDDDAGDCMLADGSEAPEGMLDAIVTSLIGLHDVKGLGRFRNSRTGAVYIVKPKMHGPEECGFTNRLFDAVEDLLGLPRHTIKVGVMDEERRTSANLAACIHAVQPPHRLHQHGLPRSHRRRDPHVDARRADGPKAR
jgi:malate synthase